VHTAGNLWANCDDDEESQTKQELRAILKCHRVIGSGRLKGVENRESGTGDWGLGVGCPMSEDRRTKSGDSS